MKSVKCRELLRALERAGFAIVRQSGSHRTFRHPDGRQVTIACHEGAELWPGLVAKILRQAGLNEDDL